MKKLVIFLSLTVALLVVGCQKEDIRPNTFNQSASDDSNEKALKSPGSDNNTGRPIETITDPNHDEDEDGKTKR